VAFHDIPLLIRRGEYHDRQRGGCRVGADGPQHPDPVEPGELEIEKHHGWLAVRIPLGVGPSCEQVVHRLDTILNHGHLIPDAVYLQCLQHQQNLVGVVFNQQQGPLCL